MKRKDQPGQRTSLFQAIVAFTLSALLLMVYIIQLTKIEVFWLFMVLCFMGIIVMLFVFFGINGLLNRLSPLANALFHRTSRDRRLLLKCVQFLKAHGVFVYSQYVVPGDKTETIHFLTREPTKNTTNPYAFDRSNFRISIAVKPEGLRYLLRVHFTLFPDTTHPLRALRLFVSSREKTNLSPHPFDIPQIQVDAPDLLTLRFPRPALYSLEQLITLPEAMVFVLAGEQQLQAFVDKNEVTVFLAEGECILQGMGDQVYLDDDLELIAVELPREVHLLFAGLFGPPRYVPPRKFEPWDVAIYRLLERWQGSQQQLYCLVAWYCMQYPTNELCYELLHQALSYLSPELAATLPDDIQDPALREWLRLMLFERYPKLHAGALSMMIDPEGGELSINQGDD